MFNFPKCSECNATLPIATGICQHCTSLSPSPAQESQCESVAAPAEAVQGEGTITCAACGSTNTESCCHPAEFCQAICNDCNTPLNADGTLWKDQTESGFFVPSGAVVLGTFIRHGVSFPYGSVDGGYFLSDEFGWGWWPDLLPMISALSIRLEAAQPREGTRASGEASRGCGAASAINFGGQESAHTPSVVPAGNTGTTVLQGGAPA